MHGQACTRLIDEQSSNKYRLLQKTNAAWWRSRNLASSGRSKRAYWAAATRTCSSLLSLTACTSWSMSLNSVVGFRKKSIWLVGLYSGTLSGHTRAVLLICVTCSHAAQHGAVRGLQWVWYAQTQRPLRAGSCMQASPKFSQWKTAASKQTAPLPALPRRQAAGKGRHSSRFVCASASSACEVLVPQSALLQHLPLQGKLNSQLHNNHSAAICSSLCIFLAYKQTTLFAADLLGILSKRQRLSQLPDLIQPLCP